MPPPEPRSSTVSPARSSARAVGLPQPREASTACAGSPAVWAASYSSAEIGSAHVEPPQPGLPVPWSTWSAAWAYFSRTVSLRFASLIVRGPPLLNQQMLIFVRRQKWRWSAAARPATAAGVFPGLHGRGKRRDRVERVTVQRVIDPAPLPAIAHQSGVLQRLEMERQQGLCGAEGVLELAHAALGMGEQPDDLQPGLVGERVEPARGAAGLGEGGRRHA